MLLRHRVVSSVIVSLEQSPKALYGVGVDVAMNILPTRMLDTIVFVANANCLAINSSIISHKMGISTHILCKSIGNYLCLTIRNLHGSHFTATLCHTHNGRLARTTLFHFMLTTEIGFVYFDYTPELALALLHRFSYAHIHKPSSLLRYTDLLCKFDRRNALLASCEEIYSDKPLLQGNLTLTKKGASLDSEVLSALVATITLAVGEAHYLVMLAVRAGVALGKADSFKVLTASLLTIKDVHELG